MEKTESAGAEGGWSRVADAPEPAAPAPAEERLTPERLLELLADERRDADEYRALAALARGAARRTLGAMAGDEERHARTAGAMYYLLTGKRPQPPEPRRSAVRGLCRTLRARYEQELGAAEEYGALAGASAAMGPALRKMAEEERGHAQALLTLLQGCL